MIWQESPSLALLVPRLIKYAILMAIVLIACAVGRGVVGSNPAAQAALERGGIRATAEGRSAGPRAGWDTSRGAAIVRRRRLLTGVLPMEHPKRYRRRRGANRATKRDLGLDRILLLIKLGFGGLFTLLLLLYLLKLKTTKYCASSQRLIVEEGSWHSENRPYELHRLGDAVIQRPLLLRMMGVSNLVIIAPHIELYGAAQCRLCARYSAPGAGNWRPSGSTRFAGDREQERGARWLGATWAPVIKLGYVAPTPWTGVALVDDGLRASSVSMGFSERP